MPSTREIRRRIRSAKNIAQITRAMEMVAASRMKRAQQAVLAGRPYAEKIAEVIHHLAGRLQGGDDEIHPLLKARPVKNVLVILFTADKGLAGALNTNVIRRTTRFLLNEVNAETSMVTVGRKGRDFMVRYGRRLTAEFINLGDRPSIRDIYPIARVATEEYTGGRVDAVYLVYTDYVNTLIQKPTVYRLLPVDVAGTGDEGSMPGDNQPHQAEGGEVEYIYEPGPGEVLSQLVPI
jgi:F-type H+-transporting ATPase subunit gamma